MRQQNSIYNARGAGWGKIRIENKTETIGKKKYRGREERELSLTLELRKEVGLQRSPEGLG